MPTFLNVEDYDLIVAEPVAERRARLVCRLYGDYDVGALDAGEAQAALSVFRALARDRDQDARAAFADFVAGSSALPVDIAERLAGDIPRVSSTIVARSPMLSDAFLVDLVGANEISQQIAVARRSAVAAPVAAALIEVAPARVCLALLGNSGAKLPNFAFDRLAARFPNNRDLRTSMLARPEVTGSLVEQQLADIAQRLGNFVSEVGWLDAQSAHVSTKAAIEQALAMYAHGRAPSVADRLVRWWVNHGRVGGPFIIRAASLGADAVLESLFSEGAGLPVSRVRAILADRGTYGLRSLCAHMGLAGEVAAELIRVRLGRADIVPDIVHRGADRRGATDVATAEIDQFATRGNKSISVVNTANGSKATAGQMPDEAAWTHNIGLRPAA